MARRNRRRTTERLGLPTGDARIVCGCVPHHAAHSIESRITVFSEANMFHTSVSTLPLRLALPRLPPWRNLLVYTANVKQPSWVSTSWISSPSMVLTTITGE